MHPQTPAPVLSLHESRLGEYDPRDPADLSLLWSVFSKTSRALENGDRLMNLSWRLWNRETVRCASRKAASATSSRTSNTSQPHAPSSIPELSSSVESSSSSSTGSSCDADLAAVTPLASTNDAPLSCSKIDSDRHIVPLNLQQLVHSMNNKPDLHSLLTSMRASQPIDTVKPPVCRRPVKTESSTSTVATNTDSFTSTDPVSDTSVSSDGGSQHSIVRGFTPGAGITTYTSRTQLAPVPTPILKNSSSKTETAAKKKTGMFMVGGSSAEDDESFRERMSARSRPSIVSRESQCSAPKKQTSFKEEVSIMRDHYNFNQESEDALESDSEFDPDEADENGVADDDDAWEDDESEPSQKELNFYRVDSKANLNTRRSALTLNLEEQRSGKSLKSLSHSTPALRRSRTSTPNGPSIPASPTNEPSMEQRAAQIPISKPTIMTTTNTAPIPLTSPRTTRRNMLAGELSESLRRNMLSERQQKNPLGINQMRRAHTVFDVSKLSRLPEVPQENSRSSDSNDVTPVNMDAPRKVSWNHYFDHSVGEYNQAGW